LFLFGHDREKKEGDQKKGVAFFFLLNPGGGGGKSSALPPKEFRTEEEKVDFGERKESLGENLIAKSRGRKNRLLVGEFPKGGKKIYVKRKRERGFFRKKNQEKGGGEESNVIIDFLAEELGTEAGEGRSDHI